MVGCSTIGYGLDRPESVPATASGDLFCSYRDRGIMRIASDGRQTLLASRTEIGGLPVLANGITLRPDGSFLVANISDAGGLLELDADGIRPFHDGATEGCPPPPVNFVTVDELGVIWLTVSSALSPRSLAYRPDVNDGYVATIRDGRFEIVLEGLAYTNECRPDYENGWLYVAETMGRRVSRIRLDEHGVRGRVEVFARMPRGAFVDGIEVDAEGGLLCACTNSSQLLRILPDGSCEEIMGEPASSWSDEVESAFEAGQMDRPHLDTSPTRDLRNLSSVAFMGNELEMLVCGSLLGDRLIVATGPAPGRDLPWWRAPVPSWGTPFEATSGAAG